MKIIAFDPGLEKTGFAIFKKSNRFKENFIFLNSGLIKTSLKKSIQYRLLEIYQKIENLLKKYQPDLIVYEQLFFFKNKKTVISVSQAQGVILLLAGVKNIMVKTLTPLVIKQSVTGYGRADKKGIKKMVDQYIKINKKRITDDEYDAIACGLAYCFQNNQLI